MAEKKIASSIQWSRVRSAKQLGKPERRMGTVSVFSCQLHWFSFFSSSCFKIHDALELRESTPDSQWKLWNIHWDKRNVSALCYKCTALLHKYLLRKGLFREEINDFNFSRLLKVRHHFLFEPVTILRSSI